VNLAYFHSDPAPRAPDVDWRHYRRAAASAEAEDAPAAVNAARVRELETRLKASTKAVALLRSEVDAVRHLCLQHKDAADLARSIPDWRRLVGDLRRLADAESMKKFSERVLALKAARDACHIPSFTAAVEREGPNIIGARVWAAALQGQRPPPRGGEKADPAPVSNATWLEVPDGTGPGDSLYARAPGCPRVRVTVPEGLKPGERFQVRLPDPEKPQPPLRRPPLGTDACYLP